MAFRWCGNPTADDYEAALGLLKLKRMFRDSTCSRQGYRYKSGLQLHVLGAVLRITPYPSSQTRETLGILLDLNPRSVQIWFQNARQVCERPLGRKSNTSIDTRIIVGIFGEYRSRARARRGCPFFPAT